MVGQLVHLGLKKRIILAKDWAKDIFFPKFCVACNQEEGEWLCEKCFSAIVTPQPFSCLQPTVDGVSYLDNAAALFSYEENTVSKLIKLFKYNYLLEIADIFKKIINTAVIPTESQGEWRNPLNSKVKGSLDYARDDKNC